MNPLYYAGLPIDGIGWGTCNTYLSRELSKLIPLQMVDPKYDRNELPAVFTPIADHNLRPAFEGKAGKLVGYGFFEFQLGPKAQDMARMYDLIFVGSTWCKKWLESQLADHPPIEVLIQGVDCERFKPEPIEHKGFVVFSGGKFEWRKGQDLTIAAIAKLQAKYPDIFLIGAWWNPWPEVVISMAKSDVIRWAVVDGDLDLDHLCTVNGCDPERVCMLGRTPHALMPKIMNQCDCAILPSRSEGGTNLVLMEAMACGLPCVATYLRGHEDIMTPANSYGCAAYVDELVEGIEFFYKDRETARSVGAMARHNISQWTWERTAKTAVELMHKHRIL